MHSNENAQPHAISVIERQQPAPIDLRSQQYQVKSGDSLYTIAWRYGLDYKRLAEYNDIPSPYVIHPGQVLTIKEEEPRVRIVDSIPTLPKITTPRQRTFGSAEKQAKLQAERAAKASRKANASNTNKREANRTARVDRQSEKRKSAVRSERNKAHHHEKASTDRIAKTKTGTKTNDKAYRKPVVQTKKADKTLAKKKAYKDKQLSDAVHWQWPVNGKLIKGYSNSDRHKGIDISGYIGQPIHCAANGEVVYAGNGITGYGNLVIVKHASNYLSAYAHNRELLVTEGQQVKKNDVIAELGSSGTDKLKLHFQIRREGKPVNPLSLLPAMPPQT